MHFANMYKFHSDSSFNFDLGIDDIFGIGIEECIEKAGDLLPTSVARKNSSLQLMSIFVLSS